MPAHCAPWRFLRDVRIVEPLWAIAAALAEHSRPAARMEIGGDWGQARDPHGRVVGSHGEEHVVPVDLHVGTNPHMMIGREELSREVNDDRFVFTGWEAQVLDDGPPVSSGIANGERRPLNLHRFPLGDRRVDARVSGKEPTLEKHGDFTGVREWAEVKYEIVRLRNALEWAGDESSDVGVVLRSQQRQQISATLVCGGERQLLIANLMDRELAG